MRKRHSRRSRETNTELNITAFMNLMVVLVPFLLISAVFSQVSILTLNLPGTGASAEKPEEPPKALEVIVRKDKLEVIERSSRSYTAIDNTEEGYDFTKLNEALVSVKAIPDFAPITSITLLLEEDIEYDVLVQTMDAVRATKQVQIEDGNEVIVFAELFPDISIGSAPAAAQ